MKKIIYIFHLLIMVFLNSCEVDGGETSYPRTRQAKVAYDKVEKRTNQIVTILDLMTKVNYYLQAPVEESEGIKNYYLRGYELTNTSDSCILKNAEVEIVFSHNGKSLEDIGAVWSVKISANNWSNLEKEIIINNNLKVKCLGGKSWEISTLDIQEFSPSSYSYYYSPAGLSTGVYSVTGSTAYEKSSDLYDFKVFARNGKLDWAGVKVLYTIVSPLSYSSLSIIAGEFDITVNEDKIKAKIYDGGTFRQNIQIEFKGITELYY